MTSQPGKQTIPIQILPNISRSKGNQTMKFSQLIEYNTRNIFSSINIHKMWWRNYFQILFWKIKIERISGSIVLMQFVLITWQVDGYRDILKPSCMPLVIMSYKAFLKNRKRYGTSLPASFCAWFLKKNIYLTIFCSLTKFYCLFAFT